MTAELDLEVTFGSIRGIPFSHVVAPELLLSGPARLWGWSVRESGGNPSTDNTVGASAAFAGGAAGNAALGVNAAVTGFDVTMAAVAAAVGGTVTLSNVIDGPYNYNFEGLVGAASLLSVRFRDPLVASGGAPSVAISAIAGGGAGNINMYGQSSPGSDAVLSIDDAGQSIAEISLPAGTSESVWLGPMGMHVSGRVYLNVLIGNVTGVVYASFDR